jgi:hypothetical protein
LEENWNKRGKIEMVHNRKKAESIKKLVGLKASRDGKMRYRGKRQLGEKRKWGRKRMCWKTK